MNEWYLLLTPVVVLAVLWLFRFAGCSFNPGVAVPTFGVPYPDEVASDNPVGYWRLNETSGNIAKNEVAGSPDAHYGQAANPLPEDTQIHSPAANPIMLQLGQPPLLASDPVATSIRVQGAFVRLDPDARFNPPQFTLEALVLPDWDLTALGKYYCVMESSSHDPALPNTEKKFGYALYAGPDDPNDPNSPYHWQLWAGDGNSFVRFTEKPYNDPANPGPVPLAMPTYLAASFDGTQAFLFMYVQDRDINYVKYELNPVAYQPATGVELFIGVTDSRRSLFPPFPGPGHVIYPLIGRLEEIAIYSSALDEMRIGSHAHTAIEGM